MEEKKTRTDDLWSKLPISKQLQNREEAGLSNNSSPGLTADMDTSSDFADPMSTIERTYGSTDSLTGDSSRSGSGKQLEMNESTSLEQSWNLALSCLEKLPIEEKQNFIQASLRNVPVAQQAEMLSQMAKIKDVERHTFPSRAVHFETSEMEKQPGRPRTWCRARQPSPYPSRLLSIQFANTGLLNLEVLSSAKPLETLFGISEDSVYEDAKENVVGILEQPLALDQPETELRARALVHAVHVPINNAMSIYMSQQKAGKLAGTPQLLREETDEAVIGSGNFVQISGRVTAAIMAGLAARSCSKPFENLYSSMAATMQKLSERLKSQAERTKDPEDVLPTPATLLSSVVPVKSVSLNGSFNYSLGENIATFSQEDMTQVTQAASEVLFKTSRCMSTELLPTPDDVDAEVSELVQTVASDMERLYNSTKGSSSLKELVTTDPSTGAENFSLASRVALNSALAGIYKSVHNKIKCLFSKSATSETGESNMTPAPKASSETRSVVSSSPILPEAFQDTSSSPVASCSSPRVPADLEVDESTENAAETKMMKDAEAELSGLMERMLFIEEDPGLVETKLDILLCSGALRPLTDQLAKQIHAFMQANIHARAPATRQCASDMAIPHTKTTGKNQRDVLTHEGFKDLVYIFTESKIRALLENVVDLMFPTPAALEIVECSHSAGRLPVGHGGCHNQLTCIFQEITGLFTRKTVKNVSDTMFRTVCCLPLNKAERVSTPRPSHLDPELRSVVNQLVARTMAKIGGKVENQEISTRVCAQVLSLVCTASGLKEDQVYPKAIDVDRIYKAVKRAIRAQFGSKQHLRTAVADNDLIFERSLVCILSYALVKPIKEREVNDKPPKKPSLLKRLFQKKAKQEEPCRPLSNQDNTTSPAEECTMASGAASTEEPPAIEQEPQKIPLWIRFCAIIVKTCI